VTPGSERPARERKMVERYSAPEPGRSATKPLSIEKVILKSYTENDLVSLEKKMVFGFGVLR